MPQIELVTDFGPVITDHLKRLTALDKRAFEGVREEIGAYFKLQIRENLNSQTLFDGRPMPQSKAAIKRQGKTLMASRTAGLYGDYGYQLRDQGVEWGSSLAYAAIHHFGGETGGKRHRFTLPARPVMGIRPQDERKIGDLLIDEIRNLEP